MSLAPRLVPARLQVASLCGPRTWVLTDLASIKAPNTSLKKICGFVHFHFTALEHLSKVPRKASGSGSLHGGVLGKRGNGRRAGTQEGVGSWAWLEKGPFQGPDSTGELVALVSWGPSCCPWPSSYAHLGPWAGAHVQGAFEGLTWHLGPTRQSAGDWGQLGSGPESQSRPKAWASSFSYSSGVGHGGV